MYLNLSLDFYFVDLKATRFGSRILRLVTLSEEMFATIKRIFATLVRSEGIGYTIAN